MSSKETLVSCDEPVGSESGVSRHQEVSDDTVSSSATLSIVFVILSGEESYFRVDPFHTRIITIEKAIEFCRRTKVTRKLAIANNRPVKRDDTCCPLCLNRIKGGARDDIEE